MNEELSAEERQALDALPREVDPPPELEDRTVQALKGRGKLHLGHGTGGWQRMLAAAAAAASIRCQPAVPRRDAGQRPRPWSPRSNRSSCCCCAPARRRPHAPTRR